MFLYTLASITVSALPHASELQRVVDTREFQKQADGMIVVVKDVELKPEVNGPLYTARGVDDTCVVYYNTSPSGQASMLNMRQNVPDRAHLAWVFALLSHEVSHCLHGHHDQDHELLGLHESEAIRRLEAESDIYGLYQTKQNFTAEIYEVVYNNFIRMRQKETEHAHSTYPYLRLIQRIKP